MADRTAFIVISALFIVALLALVVLIGSPSGNVTQTARPTCPWQFQDIMFLEKGQPMPEWCIRGHYASVKDPQEYEWIPPHEGDYLCCNMHLQKTYTHKPAADEKYIKQKSGVGAYY